MKKLKWIIRFLEVVKWGMLVLLASAIIHLLVNDEPVINLNTSYVALDDPQREKEVESLLKFGEYQLLVTDYDLEFPNSTEVEVASGAAGVLVIAYLFWVLQLIVNLVKTVRAGKSFSFANIARLKRIALLIILAPVLMEVLQQVFMAYFSSLYDLPEQMTLRFGLELDFSVLIIGFLLYAIAIAFGEGLKMREEQELTI